ncbi:MAG: sulfite exporter TauE/SafE family protein [Hylemonella sp.]
MDLPFITDPFFYLVAVPSVLLVGISKSGFGMGFGSLATPLMALTVTVPQAAAIMVPLLTAIDLMGIRALRKDLDRQLFKFLLPWALLGVVIGAVLFGLLDAKVVAGIVGIFTLLALAQRFFFPPNANSKPPPRWVGAILTVTSGFTSFVAHAGGPPLSAYVLPLRMPPLVYASTLNYLFFFVNLAKWGPYAMLGLLDLRNMATSLVLLPVVPLGVVMGVWMARRISPKLFYQLVYLGLFLTGCKLVWDGFLSA